MKRYYSAITLLPAFLCMILAMGCGNKRQKPTEAPPVRVKAIVAGTNASAGGFSYSGTVEAASAVEVSFQTGGKIEALYADEGSAVKKGQPLGRIESADYTDSYNIAAAQLAEAEDAYMRMKKLHDADALPEIKWVEVQQKVKQARNAAEIAKRAVGETVLRAPVSGTISKKYVSAGENVVPIQPVYKIVTDRNLTISISVPETDIDEISLGTPAKVSLSQTVHPLEGKVIQRDVAADPLTRTFTIKVSLPDAPESLLPGMTGTVIFQETGNGKEATEIILPSQAVELNDDNTTFVWVVDHGVAERRFITPGSLTPEGVTVKSGLAPGDTVITEGMRKVGTGTKVNIINMPKDGGSE